MFHVDEGIVPIILDSELRDDLSPSRNARIPYHDDEYLQNTFILNLNHTDANATARRNLSLATQLVKTCRLFWNDLKFFKTMYRVSCCQTAISPVFSRGGCAVYSCL